MSRLPVRLRNAALLALLAACVAPASALAGTEIEASPTRVKTGQSVSLTARTWPIPWPPESTETFYDGSTPIPGCENVEIVGEGGAAFCETTFSTPGTHQVSASYSGTENGEYEPSSSGRITIEVGEETETTMWAQSTKAKVGETLQLSAFTTPGYNLDESTDTFFDNGVPIEGCEVEVFGEGGKGFCEVTFTTPGVHRLSVSFSGTRNGEYLPSSSGQTEVEVEPAEPEEEGSHGEESAEEEVGEEPEEPKGEEGGAGSEEPEGGGGGSEEPKGEEGGAAPEEPGGGETSKGTEPEGSSGKPSEEPHPSQPVSHPPPSTAGPPLPVDPFAAPSLITSVAQPAAPALVSRPALLMINARRLTLAVRCGSSACALSAGVSVQAGRRRWRLPVEVRRGPLAGYAHVVVRIPARQRGDLRSFLLAHPQARRSVRVVLGERTLTSTATLELRTKPGFR